MENSTTTRELISHSLHNTLEITVTSSIQYGGLEAVSPCYTTTVISVKTQKIEIRTCCLYANNCSYVSHNVTSAHKGRKRYATSRVILCVCVMCVCGGVKEGQLLNIQSSQSIYSSSSLRFDMLLPSSDGTDSRQLGPDWELQKP